MPIIRDSLLKLGWSEERILVFLALWGRDELEITSIAGESGLSRKRVGEELDALIDQNLVVPIEREKWLGYRALSTGEFQNYYARQLQQAERNFEQVKIVAQELENLLKLQGRFESKTIDSKEELERALMAELDEPGERVFILNRQSIDSDHAAALDQFKECLRDSERTFLERDIPSELEDELRGGLIVIGAKVFILEQDRIISVRSNILSDLIRWSAKTKSP